MFEHLRITKMTYMQHLVHAWSGGFKLIFLAIASFVHGLLPNVFPYVTAEGIAILYYKFIHNHPAPYMKEVVERERNKNV